MKPLIIANWKMNKSVAESVSFVNQIIDSLSKINSVTTVICPPFTCLSELSRLIADTNIKLGAQNVYFEIDGAYTGEISISMLKELCSYVIVGHSERRILFKENDLSINLKLQSVINNGLNPILCVGESIESRTKGDVNQVIGEQITKGLENVASIDNLIIAYEPIWAIGTGKSASSEIAQEMSLTIRNKINDLYGIISQKIPILYGGSVKSENIKDFISQDDINGALVGSASLDPKSFVAIVSESQI